MNDIDKVIALFQLEKIDTNLFRGQNASWEHGRVFGGQVIAQSLKAAMQTVDKDRNVHALHAFFLRPGDVNYPILFEVDRVRDGGSFTTRRVLAIQQGEAIFSAQISFQAEGRGPSHSASMPDNVGEPEQHESNHEFQIRMHEANPKRIPLPKHHAFDTHPQHKAGMSTEIISPAINSVWTRAHPPISLSEDDAYCLLAYMSDMNLMGTALLAHDLHWFHEGYQFASIDHAMWFHSKPDPTQWLLYYLDSPWAGNGRGMNRGLYYNQFGTMIATVTQEGLMREKRPK